ncbi:MAG: magnesium transporter [Clostridia bacterium]|nr:magnesium transporter [Clostridia bacterium]
MEEINETKDELLSLLSSDLTESQLAERLSDYHLADIAALYPELDEATRLKIESLLSQDELADLYSYIDNAEDYLNKMDRDRAADIIESMDADDAVDVLDNLEEQTRSELIGLMDDEAVEDINLISSYGDNAVGSMMTTNFILIRSDMTVKQAMRSMIDQASDNDNVSTVYVENADGVYCGAINLRDLIVAREGTPLDDIIMTSYPSVYADAEISECIERLKDYGEDSIPVLDKKDAIIGVVTAGDLVEAVDEALGEDYAKFAGLAAEEELNEPVHKSIKKRLPWLVILLALGLLVSMVVSAFETVIAGLPIIVSFQSLILDMAGNVGTQSLAVTIRVLTDENLSRRRTLKLVGKEIRVGFTNGLMLGTCSFAVIGAFLCISNPAGTAFMISACIGFALLAAMTVSSATGTLIPLFFKKIKIDPAVASGPLITTVNDLVAVVVYYGLAWLLILNAV